MIDSLSVVKCQTWEELNISGHLIIDQIFHAINTSAVACFDVTQFNSNVMFELGYAIGSNKRVWLLFDPSDEEAGHMWTKIRTLTTIGYSPYKNADDVRQGFLKDSPHLADKTIFQANIENSLQPSSNASIFYLPSNHATEASRQLTQRLHRETVRGRRSIDADPREASVYPLTWYAQQIYNTEATIAHLTAPRRTDAAIHNARVALVCGMAIGMKKKVLIVAEDTYVSPIDYRDLVFTYDSARRLIQHADTWLETELTSPGRPAASSAPRSSLELGTELRSLHLGEPVAENESAELAEYFIETGSYLEVLEKRTTVFVGRKGAGKTANFLRASAQLGSDRRNLVVVIKPFGYEFEALVSLLSQYTDKNAKNFVVETLWQYLLYSEIAVAAANEIRQRPAGVPSGSAEWELLRFVDEGGTGVNLDFAVRLERAVTSVLPDTGGSIEDQRAAIAEGLHGGVIRDLRRLLGDALADRDRVCVLIDNLDKAWDRSADIDQLAFLILGLLTAIGRVDVNFGKQDKWRAPVSLTLAAFVRSDIFEHVSALAREPDKIPVTRLVWRDRSLLFRVVEERYLASHPSGSGEELWDRFFTPTVRGRAVHDYIAFRTLPRPRDMIQFCKAAHVAALNARHIRIEEEDVLAADVSYSQFAFEALLVENGITIKQLEDVLFEFAGSPPKLSRNDVETLIRSGGIDEEHVEKVLRRLRELSFLGIETSEEHFEYADESSEFRRADVLARRVAERIGEERFEVHPAYRPFLEISDFG